MNGQDCLSVCYCVFVCVCCAQIGIFTYLFGQFSHIHNIYSLHLQSPSNVLVRSRGDPKLDQGTKYHDGTAPSQFKQMSEEDRRQAVFA